MKRNATLIVGTMELLHQHYRVLNLSEIGGAVIVARMTERKNKVSDTKAVRVLLESNACPVPFHAVRTHFLGAIATPILGGSPLRVVEGLWGGELPEFGSMADAQALIGALVQGLWNDLTRHQKRAHPFHLTRMSMEATAPNLRHFGQVRKEELDGFVEGLFAGEGEIDLPERAHVAVRSLGEMRGMMVGIVDLVDRDPVVNDPTQLETTFRGLRDLTRIMEAEIHEAVLSCARARRQMLEGIPTMNPTVH